MIRSFIAIVSAVGLSLASILSADEAPGPNVDYPWSGMNLIDRPSMLYSEKMISEFCLKVGLPKETVTDRSRSAGCGIEMTFSSIVEVNPYFVIIHRYTGVYCYVSCPSALKPLAEFLSRNVKKEAGKTVLSMKPGMYVNGKFIESELKHEE